MSMFRGLALSLWAVSVTAFAAGAESPDFRIRADLDDALGQSVGNATFRIKSRFMQVYYGGVTRNDEYRFSVQLDSLSLDHLDLDVFLDVGLAGGDYFLGSFLASDAGLLDVNFRSRWHVGDEPDLPLPTDFPELVDVGHLVKIFDTGTHELLFSAALEEEFLRGDVNQDKKVDELDFVYLEQNFGSLNAIGPANGDFTGDNRSNIEDYNVFALNFTGDKLPPPPSAVPLPAAAWLLAGGLPFLLRGRRTGRALRAVLA